MLQLDFPHPFTPDTKVRAGRMMAAGRVKLTMTTLASGEHITVLYKCFADNRNRQYDSEISKNWVEAPLEWATHVFAEVPRPSGEWNDKIGTYYPRTGKWFDADDADPRRVDAAKIGANWIAGNLPNITTIKFQEASECSICGIELSDPISIARGIGPTCYGKMTNSVHQVKWALEAEALKMSGAPNGDDELAQRMVDANIQEQATLLDVVSTPNTADILDQASDGHMTFDHEMSTVTVENLQDLGLTSAAENAMFSLALGLDESQLETLSEWTFNRLEKVRQVRRQVAAAARAARDTPTAREISGDEAHSPGADSLNIDRGFMAR